jgi:hypothetical protein
MTMGPDELDDRDDTSDERVRDRGDASDLVGTAIVRRADGTLVPLLDDEGDEILGIATGPQREDV